MVSLEHFKRKIWKPKIRKHCFFRHLDLMTQGGTDRLDDKHHGNRHHDLGMNCDVMHWESISCSSERSKGVRCPQSRVRI